MKTMRLDILNKVPVAPAIAALFGVVSAILVVATPQWLFQRGIVASGVPNLIAAASPPLGDKARIMAAVIAAVMVAGILWAVISAIEKIIAGRTAKTPKAEPEAEVPQDGQTYAQIVASRRRPIFAEADLGAPFMSDEAIAMARDELVLETPIADAQTATEAVPLLDAPVEAIASEIEPVEAAPLPEPEPATIAAEPQMLHEDDDDESVARLMDRLEAALARRQARLGADAPMPGDIGSLRAALGMTATG
jgi:hypothetical protein